MHPKRRIIYYAILLASVLWISGTITFLFFQDIEVTVQVKRRIDQQRTEADQTLKSLDKRASPDNPRRLVVNPHPKFILEKAIPLGVPNQGIHLISHARTFD